MGKFQIGKKQYKGESSQFSKEYVDKKLGEHRSAEPLDHPDGSVTAQKLAEQSVELSKLAAAVTDYFATAAEVQEHITDTDNPHRVDKTDLGLDQVENTSDLDKPISNETQAALAGKVDKAPGMGLSHNDYTDIEKQRLSDVIHNLYTHRTAAELDHPDRSVTRYKLADDSVVAAKIADGHVINSKLADGAVTLNKLADDVLKKIDVLPTEIGDIQEAVQNGVYLYHGHIACDGTYVIHVQSGELENGGYAVSQTAFCVAVDDVADSAYLGRIFRRSGIWEPGETDLPEEWLQEHEGRMEARDLDACKETGLYDIQFADLTEAERAKFPAEAQGIQSGEFRLLSFCGGAVQFLICETAGEQDGQGQPLADGRMWVRSVYGDEPAAWQRRYDLEAIDNLTSADVLRPLSANQGRVLKSIVDGKVDKEAGKGLSTNDYTDAEKEKLAGIEAGAQVNDVTSVAGKTGAVTLDKADVGLEFVTLAETDGVAVGIETEMTGMGGAIGKRSGAGDGFAGGYTAWTQSGGAIGNGASSAGGGAAGEGAQAGDGFAGGKAAKVTQNIDAIQLGTGTNPTAKTLQVYEYQMMDANGKIPDARMPQLDTKVDKVTGKGLSTNDYTTEEKTKLAGIETGANNYVHPASHPATMITEDTAHRFASDTEKVAWNGKLDTGNIKAGANVSVSVSGNDVTISSTGGGGAEVGIVDNLESTSTTDALSANQGRVLKGEVDGKAAASHTHTKTQITDFAHTHGKSDITDFAHTHTKTDITDFPNSMTPTSHASTATTYGVGTATQYGHVKLANNLTTTATGSALDARQGKVLQDSKLEASDIVAGDNIEVDTSGGTVTISASGGGYEVGDMLTTVRSNLDDTWLLCNGDSVSPTEYPELAPLCPSAMIGKWSDEIDATFTSVTDAIAANGYFVVLNSSSKSLYYTTNPLTGNWTTASLPSTITPSTIRYLNGYWVVTPSSGVTIAYSKNLNSGWTTKTITASGVTSSNKLTNMTYGGTDYIIGVKGSKKILYAMSLTASKWNSNSNFFSENANVFKLDYDPYAGRCLATCDSSSTLSKASFVLSGSVRSSSYWDVFIGSNTSNPYETLMCTNNRVVALRETTLLYSSSSVGNITTVDLSDMLPTYGYLSGVIYSNGYWVVTYSGTSSSSYFLYSKDLQNWNKTPDQSITNGTLLGNNNYCIRVDGDTYIAVKSSDAILPIVSTDASYTYIKAK